MEICAGAALVETSSAAATAADNISGFQMDMTISPYDLDALLWQGGCAAGAVRCLPRLRG